MQDKNIGTRDYGIIEGLDKIDFDHPPISKTFTKFSEAPNKNQMNLVGKRKIKDTDKNEDKLLHEIPESIKKLKLDQNSLSSLNLNLDMSLTTTKDATS